MICYAIKNDKGEYLKKFDLFDLEPRFSKKLNENCIILKDKDEIDLLPSFYFVFKSCKLVKAEIKEIEDDQLLEEKDTQIANLQHQLDVAEKALNEMANDWCLIDNPNKPSDVVKKYKEQAENKSKGE